MKLKFLIFLWFGVSSLFAQDSTCVKIEKAITGYYSYFFSFDADYKQYFKPEKIRTQQIEELRFAVLNPKDIHCSTMIFGFDSNGEVDNVVLLDSEMPANKVRKLVIIRDSLNRVTQKIKAPIDDESMLDTIGQYFIKSYSYNQKGNLIKTHEDIRNGVFHQEIEEFQYDDQNRIEKIDFQMLHPLKDVQEQFIYRYKRNKILIERCHNFHLGEGEYRFSKVTTTIKKFDKNGRLILEKDKHGSSNDLRSRNSFRYNDLGLITSEKLKRTKAMAMKGGTSYEKFRCEYKDGILSLFQFRSFYSLKRIK